MNKKVHGDIVWKDVPQKRKIKVALCGFIIALCAVIVGVLICWGCGLLRGVGYEAVNKVTQADLNGIGLDDIMLWEEPEAYGDCAKTIGKNGELIGSEWSDEDSMIFICMETYKGQRVMGLEKGDINSYIKQKQYNLEPIYIGRDGEVKTYISAEPILAKTENYGPAEDWNPPEDTCRMEAVFQYGEYVISLRVEKFEFSNDGAKSDSVRPLTRDQIESFYNTLDTITFYKDTDE